MKNQTRKILTNEDLLNMLNKEIEENGQVYTEKRKAILEMLRMRGVNV